jgi:hypothetical protein
MDRPGITPDAADGQWLTCRQIGELHHISKASAKRLAWASRPFVARVQRRGTNDTAKDIAKGIVFLASYDAGYMNGAGFIVDGGARAT